MKVLITGGGGFIAQSINQYLKNEFEVDCYNRSELNLMDIEHNSLKKYDAVIHCAIQGGTYGENNSNTFYNNLFMTENLISNIDESAILINIGSGAEFVKNSDDTPKDYYGLSKRIISKVILERDNSFNLRVFGCFGYGENKNRFLNRCVNSDELVINKNIIIDYFYVDDLSRVIKFFLLNQDFVGSSRRADLKNMDCVYYKKRNLLEMANFVKENYNKNLMIKVNDDSEKNNWEHIGNGSQIKKIQNFMEDQIIGFEHGVKEYYEKYKLSN